MDVVADAGKVNVDAKVLTVDAGADVVVADVAPPRVIRHEEDEVRRQPGRERQGSREHQHLRASTAQADGSQKTGSVTGGARIVLGHYDLDRICPWNRVSASRFSTERTYHDASLARPGPRLRAVPVVWVGPRLRGGPLGHREERHVGSALSQTQTGARHSPYHTS